MPLFSGQRSPPAARWHEARPYFHERCTEQRAGHHPRALAWWPHDRQQRCRPFVPRTLRGEGAVMLKGSPYRHPSGHHALAFPGNRAIAGGAGRWGEGRGGEPVLDHQSLAQCADSPLSADAPDARGSWHGSGAAGTQSGSGFRAWSVVRRAVKRAGWPTGVALTCACALGLIRINISPSLPSWGLPRALEHASGHARHDCGGLCPLVESDLAPALKACGRCGGRSGVPGPLHALNPRPSRRRVPSEGVIADGG